MELSVQIILAALNNDEAALLQVLEYYDKYINAFSYEKYKDEHENVRVRLDLDTKQQLHAKLLTALKQFDIDRALEE